jgi:GT2 family glycosyltransferase
MEADQGRMNSSVDDSFVDIVVPVYNAPDDVRRCVESVLAHDHRNCRITLIDDASIDPGISAYFDELRARALPEVELLVNERNLGFTGTANRGMTRSRADVVLLNSDTIVTAGWLEALRRCAGSDSRIGTITPFSNNAEICSFPRFCVDNPWRLGDDPEPVRAALVRAAVPSYPDLPTGVGFCMFVRRALIDAIGAFDMAFGLGYGEENDFCLRAARAGWRNVSPTCIRRACGRPFLLGAEGAFVPTQIGALLERHPRTTCGWSRSTSPRTRCARCARRRSRRARARRARFAACCT